MNFLSALFTRNISQATETFETEGHRVTVQVFAPNTGGPYPAVIALHGSGGIREGWAAEPASLLASRGFSVFVLHYFERTDTTWANDGNIRQNFETWMKTISERDHLGRYSRRC